MKCGKGRNGKQSTCCGGTATLEMSVARVAAHFTEEYPVRVSQDQNRPLGEFRSTDNGLHVTDPNELTGR